MHSPCYHRHGLHSRYAKPIVNSSLRTGSGVFVKLLFKFNLILFAIFGVGAVAISLVAYNFLVNNAQREVLAQAELMMASAKSVREYTSMELSPLLTQVPSHQLHFIPETVPAFGATITFSKLREHYPQYMYKEATLNPTNLEDRATDWEADVVHFLRDHPEQKQSVGQREGAMGRDLYLASPIRSAHSCLQCHSVPEAAPKSMLAVYGTQHGFGWKENEIIGAQIVSVPMSLPVTLANQAFHRLLLFLTLTLLLAIAALDTAVFWFVIRPLRIVSATADRVSRGEINVEPIATKGNDEVAVVTQSFNRMQRSLQKALTLLEEES